MQSFAEAFEGFVHPDVVATDDDEDDLGRDPATTTIATTTATTTATTLEWLRGYSGVGSFENENENDIGRGEAGFGLNGEYQDDLISSDSGSGSGSGSGSIIPDLIDYRLLDLDHHAITFDQARASFSSDFTHVTNATSISASATTTTNTTTTTPESSDSSTGVGETWSIVQTPSPPASFGYDCLNVGLGTTDGLVGFEHLHHHQQQQLQQQQAYNLLVSGGEGFGFDALDHPSSDFLLQQGTTGVKSSTTTTIGTTLYGPTDQYSLLTSNGNGLDYSGVQGLNGVDLGRAEGLSYGSGPAVFILDSQQDQYPQYYHHQQQQQQQQHHLQQQYQQTSVYPNSTSTSTLNPNSANVFRTNVRDKKDWTDITSYAASMFMDNQGQAGQQGRAQQQQQQSQPQQHQRTASATAGQVQFGSYEMTGSSGSTETGILGGSNFAQAFGSVQQVAAGEGGVEKRDAHGQMYTAASDHRGFPITHPSFGPVVGQSQYQNQQRANEGYYYSASAAPATGNGSFQPTFAGKVLPAYASVGAVVQAQLSQQGQQQQQSQSYQHQANQAQTGLIVSPRIRPSMVSTGHTSVEDYHRAMAAQNVGEMQHLLGGPTAAQQQQQQQVARVKVEDDVEHVGSTQTIESLVDELDAEVEAALAGPAHVSRGPSLTGKSKSTASNRLKSHRSKAPYHRSVSTDAQSSTDRGHKSASASVSFSSSSSPSSSEGTVISRNVLYEDGKPKIRNPFGGGRGYVPGETPDDPSKRHKCEVCGRGFARLFNLKSHAATHDPARKKPFPCPHDSCPRSFSRLHDLERHRQGIHSDGPLMDAKVQGIAPALARAQERIHARETAKANPAHEDASPFADQAD